MSFIKKRIASSKLYSNYKKIMIKFVTFFPINNKKVIFDNFGGRGFGDDPKYIAQELLKRNKGIKMIWVTSDMSTDIPKGIKKVKYGTIRASYHWATSKVWVDNIKNTLRVDKKKGQYYIQTWHSTLGFKMNEQDADDLPKTYVSRAIHDAKQTDLMYSNNDFRLDKYRNRYWYSGEVIKCDVPRMSILHTSDDELKQSISRIIGFNKSKKILLYAPTFRKTFRKEDYKLEYKKLLDTVNQVFDGEFIILMRLHPNAAHLEDELNLSEDNVFSASQYPDMQELLAISDVLITDYSGCMFDFSFVNKPVFLYANDLDRYLKKERKLYFSLSEVPFNFANNYEELYSNLLNFNNEKYLKDVSKFKTNIGYQDQGKGSQVIADKIMQITGIE